jgi:hypothetical protein
VGPSFFPVVKISSNLVAPFERATVLASRKILIKAKFWEIWYQMFAAGFKIFLGILWQKKKKRKKKKESF